MPVSNFNKFNDFIKQLGLKQHNLNTDPLYVFLTNEAPIASDATRADIADLSTGGGYTEGGFDTQNTASEAGGVLSVIGVDFTITASGGSIGPFRYVVLYNQIGGLSSTNKLIGWWDYGESITLQDNEELDIDFGATMFTVS